MKTTVNVPDDLFDRAEKLARRMEKSRSQVYQEALAEYLLRRDSDSVTEAMDRALAQIDQVSGPWLSQAGSQMFERAEW